MLYEVITVVMEGGPDEGQRTADRHARPEMVPRLAVAGQELGELLPRRGVEDAS